MYCTEYYKGWFIYFFSHDDGNYFRAYKDDGTGHASQHVFKGYGYTYKSREDLKKAIDEATQA